MRVSELRVELERLQISQDTYSIMVGGLPNEKLCLVHEDTWKIYYSERGMRTGEKSYLSEEEACEAFLRKLVRYAK